MAQKKGPSSSLQQVHFLTGQATFKAYLLNGQNTGKSSSNKIINLGRIPLGLSGSRTGIQDHLDHGPSNFAVFDGCYKDSSVHLIYHDAGDHRSLILKQIIPKERTLTM